MYVVHTVAEPQVQVLLGDIKRSVIGPTVESHGEGQSHFEISDSIRSSVKELLKDALPDGAGHIALRDLHGGSAQ